MRKNLTPILFAIAVVAMILLVGRSIKAGASYTPRDKDVAGAKREAPAPPGAKDERAAMPEGGLVGGMGIVEPAQRESRLAFASAGVVGAIRVKDGDRVKEGDVLAELESLVEEAALKSAEADLANARAQLSRTLNGLRAEDRVAAVAEANAAKARAELSASPLTRAEELMKKGALTQEELDRARQNAAADQATARAAAARAQAAEGGSRGEDIAAARAALVAAEARVEQAKATLARRKLVAPFAGEILQVKARSGEYYTPGQSEPPVVLGDTSRLRARIDVDERDVDRVKIGKAAFVTGDAFPGVKFQGKVAEIGRRMGRKNVRTDDPTERLDTKILEVVVDLDPSANKLVPGLRITGFIEP